jgi:glycosyltransferase involved in cell wall biosynthesis
MKKNIAIVITRLDLGGAQKVALYIAKNLDRKKFNVHLIAGKGGFLDAEAQKFSGRLVLNLWPELVHPVDLPMDIAAFFKLADYFKKNNIDVVHTHSSKAGLLGRLAAAYAKVPKIIHTVHGFPFHEYQNAGMHCIYVMLEKFAAKYTTELVSVGSDVTGYGLKNGVGARQQYEMIRAAVDVKNFKAQSLKFRAGSVSRAKFLGSYGLDPDKYTVGMIGNLKKQKNPEGFVKTAAEALNIDPDIQFIFAGGGKGLEDMIQMTRKYGISDRVKFAGWVKSAEDFMGSIDLFLLTSLWEGLPCTLAQAFASGKPVVASDIGGNSEFVKDFKAGELYPPFDHKAAAQKIKAFKDKKIKYRPDKQKFGEFELKNMLKKYEKIYNG